MKKYNFILTLSLLVLFSCQEKNGPSQQEDQQEISLSQEVLEFGTEAGEGYDVHITSSSAWELTGWTGALAAWLSVDKHSGEGSETIRVSTVEDNPYYEDRVAVLGFRIDNGPEAKLCVKQARAINRAISLSKSNLIFSAFQGESEVVTVRTGVPWAIEGYTDEIKQWLSISPVEGDGETQVTLTSLLEGAEGSPRTARVVFRTGPLNSAQLSITQKAKPREPVEAGATVTHEGYGTDENTFAF